MAIEKHRNEHKESDKGSEINFGTRDSFIKVNWPEISEGITHIPIEQED